MKPLFLLLCAVAAHGQGLVREEQPVEIDGVNEVWRLQWNAPPKPACDKAGMLWETCPCAGFAFAESGSLDLLRLRQGRVVERLSLTPAFTDGLAIVQRSEPQGQAPVRIMKFADYNHDGRAAEFYLQTSSGPCGHTQGVMVGISSSNPRLHVFGSALHPDQPLVLQKFAWDALLKARSPVRVVDWHCDDHGKNRQIELLLQPAPAGIDVVREEYLCPRLENGRLIRKARQ